MASLDLHGRQFGFLRAIQRVNVPGARNAMWQCICSCGNFSVVAASNLISGCTKSCGCHAKRTAAKLLRGNTHKQTHGMTGTPEYQAWTKLKLRCYDPNNHKYKDYGARGISVCGEWRESFEAFFKDMGRRPSARHSIGRRNNDGDYEPNNCSWETSKQQMRNARFNNIITIDNISMCVAEWCEALGVPRWKPYEMTRMRGLHRDQAPECATIDEAIEKIYRKKH